MTIIKDIEDLGNSVKSGLSGSLKEISNTYDELEKEVGGAVVPIGKGVKHFAGSMDAVLQRELGLIKKGLNTDRYNAVLKQVENGAHTAALDIAKELKPYLDTAENILEHIEDFDLTKSSASPSNANYSGELKSLLQQAHGVYHDLCASKGIEALAQLDTAFKSASLMLDAMPARLLGVLEKEIPLASVESLLAHIHAAHNEDKTVGLRAVHAQAGADNSTISYLKMGSKVSGYLESSSLSIGSALTKEVSVKINGKIQALVGVVAGWAATIAAKLGIGVKGGAGVSLWTVPFDAAAPFFVALGLFFGLLGIGLSAAAEWLEVDAQLA